MKLLNNNILQGGITQPTQRSISTSDGPGIILEFPLLHDLRTSFAHCVPSRYKELRITVTPINTLFYHTRARADDNISMYRKNEGTLQKSI